MLRLALRFAFLIVLFSLCLSDVTGSDYFFNQISIEQGLSHPGVNTVLRDSYGTLWIGTRHGLNRMNRSDLKTYFHSNVNNSIAGNYIHNLSEDKHQNLWIASDGGLSLYNRDLDNFETKLSVRVQAIAVMENGVLFGGYTAIYFYNYDTGEINRLPLINKDINESLLLKDYFISHLKPISETLVLAGTEGEGVFTYNLQSHEFAPLITKHTHPLQSVYYDKENDDLYISVFQDGLYHYDLQGSLKKHYTTKNSDLSNTIILDIEKYNGKIWLATDGSGVDILDSKTGEIENIQHIPGDINSLPVNSITILHKDMRNNLWVGSVRGGVILFKDTYIRTYKDVALGSNKGLSDKVVISLYEDKDNNLWIGTDGGGINLFTPETETFTHHLETFEEKVTSITNLSEEELLVSLYGKGVFTYNIKKRVLHPFTIKDEKINREECFSGFTPICHRITEDKILILSKNSYVYEPQTRQFNQLDYEEGITNLHSLLLVYNDDSRIFMVKDNTIYSLDKQENVIRQFLVLEDNEYITSISYDKNKGRVWIASSLGLKYYDTGLKQLRTIETNMFNRISYMYLDTANRLWINASNMLFSYDTDSGKFMIWDESDGFSLNEILTLYVDSFQSNYIFMGGSNGLVKIDKQINYNNDQPISFSLLDVELNGKIYIESLLTGSSSLKISQDYSSLKFRVDLNEKDLFRHILFRYRISSQNNNSIIESYSNVLNLASLAVGKYDLYISCMTKSGDWTKETSLITFEVIPPWYKRTWFILLTIFVILSLLTLIVFSLIKSSKTKLKWELAMHRQELNEDRIQFLTQINHELRTPLTLIYAPLKRMIDKKKGTDSMNTEQQNQIKNIYHQARHMKSVINWILDFDRNFNTSDDLDLSFSDLNKLIQKTVNDFEQEFHVKHINIKVELDNRIERMKFDKTKIRVVLSNLLMNALKFSNSNTDVIVRSRLDDDFVYVEIRDSGIGLKDVNMEKLFMRFYQGKHELKGSGMGLAYCKKLIEKHEGNIGAINNKDVGATMFFTLPYKTTDEEIVEVSHNNDESNEDLSSLVDIDNELIDTSIYTLLVVEDNKEFREFIESELKPLFKKMLTAENGVEALVILKNNQPDLLISDVMMPVMDGYELCRNVKQNIEISHIPVILLTAKSDKESQKMGYKLGADFYLSKPFDFDLLLSVIKNQLVKSEMIRQKYQTSLFPVSVKQTTISNADEQFITKLNQLIEENYSDSGFDVAAIINNMAMSRASLYSKMKSITGLGVNNYLNKFRIKAACSLLEETENAISDIAFDTGFTSQQYFSTIFKQITGKTPTVYRNEKQKS